MTRKDGYPTNVELQERLLASAADMFQTTLASLEQEPGWLAGKPVSSLQLRVARSLPAAGLEPDLPPEDVREGILITPLDPVIPEQAIEGQLDTFMRDSKMSEEVLKRHMYDAIALGGMVLGERRGISGLALPTAVYADYGRRVVDKLSDTRDGVTTVDLKTRKTTLEAAVAFGQEAAGYLPAATVLHGATGFRDVLDAIARQEEIDPGRAVMWHNVTCEKTADLPLNGIEPTHFLRGLYVAMEQRIGPKASFLKRARALRAPQEIIENAEKTLQAYQEQIDATRALLQARGEKV